MLKRGTSFVFSLLPIVLGAFLFFNDNYLNTYGQWEDVRITWIDDKLFGIIMMILGVFLFLSFLLKSIKLQTIGLVLLGSDLFATTLIYFYRWMIGLPNITWIFGLALFALIYTSILKAGDK